MDFVGYEVGSKETYWLDATTEEPVQLSNICLKSGGIAGEPLVLEMRERGTDRTAIICVLRPGIQENIKLNLLIQKAYGLTLAGGTKARVQVAGYKFTLEDRCCDEEDEEDFRENESEDGSEDGSEEEEGDSDREEEEDEESEEQEEDNDAKAIRKQYEKKLTKLEKIEKKLTAASGRKGKSSEDTRKRKGAETYSSPKSENDANDGGSEEAEGDSDREEEDDEESEEQEDDDDAKATRKKVEKKLAKLENIEKKLTVASEGRGKSGADTRKRKDLGAEAHSSPENANNVNDEKSEVVGGDSGREEEDDEESEEKEEDDEKATRKNLEIKLAKLEKIEKKLTAASEGEGKSGADARKRKDSGAEAQAENKNDAKSPKPGKVRELPYGLKIQELLIGTGPRARHGHHVSCHYTLRLENGKKIDSSGKKPFRFRLGVGEVIKGWDNGLSGMRVGGERHIIVPPRLGYGSKSMGQIPRNSTLYFDVKLVDAQ